VLFLRDQLSSSSSSSSSSEIQIFDNFEKFNNDANCDTNGYPISKGFLAFLWVVIIIVTVMIFSLGI